MIEQHLEKLAVFHATALEGSFLKAAKRLRLTQPAITKSIKLLEEQSGVQLFTRHRRGVELSPAGVLLLQFCDGLFVKVRDIEQRMLHTHALSGVLKIGTYETLGELFWPQALKLIQEKYPALIVELKTENVSNIWKNLEYENIDLVVDAEPETSNAFYSKVLYTDHFGIFCRKNSRYLKENENLPISFVKRACDRKGNTIEQHLNAKKLPFKFLYDVESFTLVRSFILEDLCIGVLPIRLAEKYLKEGKLVHFPGASEKCGEHRICATYLDSKKDEPKIDLIVKLLKSLT